MPDQNENVDSFEMEADSRHFEAETFILIEFLSKSEMTLEGEDTSATFTSIAVHTVLNRTLVHLNTSTLTMLSLWVDG